jgi:hypothetical protein
LRPLIESHFRHCELEVAVRFLKTKKAWFLNPTPYEKKINRSRFPFSRFCQNHNPFAFSIGQTIDPF